MGQSWTSLRTMMAYSVATNRREAVASAKIRLGSTEALKWYRLDDDDGAVVLVAPRPLVGQGSGLVVAAPARLGREDRLGLLAVFYRLKFHLYEEEEGALGHASRCWPASRHVTDANTDGAGLEARNY